MALLVTVNDGGERSGQVGQWIDRIELACLDERRDAVEIDNNSVERTIRPIARRRCGELGDHRVLQREHSCG